MFRSRSAYTGGGEAYGLDDIKKFQLRQFTKKLSPMKKLLVDAIVAQKGVEDKEVQTAAAIFFLVDWAASLNKEIFNKLPVSAVLKLEDLHDVVDKYRKGDVAWGKVSSYLSGDSGVKIAEILLSAQSAVKSTEKLPIPASADRLAVKMAKNLEDYKESLTDEAREAYVKARNPEPTDEEAMRCLEALVDSQVYVKWQELVDSNPVGIQKWGQTIRDAVGDVTVLQNLASSVPALGDAGNNLADKGQEWLKSTVQSYGYNWEEEVTNKRPHPVEEGVENPKNKEWEAACARVFSDANACEYGTMGSLAQFGVSGNKGAAQYYLTSDQIQTLAEAGVKKARDFLTNALTHVNKELEKGALANLTACYTSLALAHKVGQGLTVYAQQLDDGYDAMFNKVENFLVALTGKESIGIEFQELTKQVDKIKSEHVYNDIIHRIQYLRQEIQKIQGLPPEGENDAVVRLTAGGEENQSNTPVDKNTAVLALAAQARELLEEVQAAEKKPFYFPSQFLQWLSPKLYDLLYPHKAENLLERQGVKMKLANWMKVIHADEVQTTDRVEELGGANNKSLTEKVKHQIKNRNNNDRQTH